MYNGADAHFVFSTQLIRELKFMDKSVTVRILVHKDLSGLITSNCTHHTYNSTQFMMTDLST